MNYKIIKIILYKKLLKKYEKLFLYFYINTSNKEALFIIKRNTLTRNNDFFSDNSLI